MPNGTIVKPPPGATISLRTLGRATLVAQAAGHDPVEILGPGKPLALLVYLSRSPQGTASRDHLLDLLWADHAPDSARHALRQAIWYLRKRIGDESLEAGDGSVRLVAPIESEDSLFETAIEAGELPAAIDGYHGPFLPDIAVPGGARFEQWADSIRVHLQALFFRAAEVVVRGWLSSGRMREARELSTRVRDMNRLDEVGWRLVLEALCSAGDWVTARVEADALERLLAHEGRQPEPATTAAIEQARQVTAENGASPAGTTLVAELVGREREFAAVTAAWEQARLGRGVHLHITGAAGIGKTRLLLDLHARLLTVGARVVYVTANPGTRHVSYSYASDLAGALCRLPGAASVSPACASILVGLNPALSSIYDRRPDSARHDTARKYLIAVRDLIAGIADEQPIAIFADDLHWVDPTSLSLLAGLLAGVPESRVLLVTTARPHHDGFAAAAASREIELQPLTPDQVLALLSNMGGLPEEAWAEAVPELIHRATGGSPLLVLETLQLAVEQDKLRLEDGMWFCPDPSSLEIELGEGQALRRRIVELDREASWLLVLLAAAGTPLSRLVLVELVNRPKQSVDADLMDLEKRGFIARAGDDFRVAHDQIAELALEAAPEEAAQAAFGAIGKALLQHGWHDLGLLTQAGAYLNRAGDTVRLRTAFRRKVWLARTRGDRRSLSELAQETSGMSSGDAAVTQLVKGLPLAMRLGLSSPRRVAGVVALAAVGMMAGLVVWLAPRGPTGEMALLLVERSSETSRVVFAGELRRQGWEARESIGSSRRLANVGIELKGLKDRILAANPAGTRWAVARETGQAGGIEIFVTDELNGWAPLTFSPGDDKVSSWSPDGERLAVTTARWDSRSMYDIAILDPGSGNLERLTYSDYLETHPLWSPDGSRIAFHRNLLDGTPPGLCWITVDGGTSSCTPLPGYRIGRLLSWPEPDRILLFADDSAGEQWVVSTQLKSGRTAALFPGGERTTVVSPDGKWGACYCEGERGRSPQWRVFPTDDPTQTKVLEVEHDAPVELMPLWRPLHDPRAYLDELSVDSPSEAPLGVPLHMRVRGRDAAGQPLRPAMVGWTSLDTSVATVDQRGVMLPRKTGVATVVASAGGWRVDSLTVAVTESATRLVAQQDWKWGVGDGWTIYGDPTPEVVSGPDSIRALWNKNDASYQSGVYSHAAWSARDGLGIEAMLSTPITQRFQQDLTVKLDASLDSTELAEWDHETAHMPGREQPTDRRCSVVVVLSRIGSPVELRLATAAEQVAVPLDLARGSTEWYRLLVQIFPDGTCGAAVNGRPLLRSEEPLQLDREFRLITEGHSVGTRLLIGPLEVWQGVKTDVDWAVLERERREEPERR